MGGGRRYCVRRGGEGTVVGRRRGMARRGGRRASPYPRRISIGVVVHT